MFMKKAETFWGPRLPCKRAERAHGQHNTTLYVLKNTTNSEQRSKRILFYFLTPNMCSRLL